MATYTGHSNDLELFKAFEAKIGRQEAETLVQFVRKEVEDRVDRAKHTLATREDLEKVETKLEHKINISQNKIMWAIGLMGTGIIGVFSLVITLQSNNFDKRFESIDKRFESIDKRFEEQRADFKEQMRIQNEHLQEQMRMQTELLLLKIEGKLKK